MTERLNITRNRTSTTIHNQGSTQACWAHAIASCIRAAQTNKMDYEDIVQRLLLEMGSTEPQNSFGVLETKAEEYGVTTEYLQSAADVQNSIDASYRKENDGPTGILLKMTLRKSQWSYIGGQSFKKRSKIIWSDLLSNAGSAGPGNPDLGHSLSVTGYATQGSNFYLVCKSSWGGTKEFLLDTSTLSNKARYLEIKSIPSHNKLATTELSTFDVEAPSLQPPFRTEYSSSLPPKLTEVSSVVLGFSILIHVCWIILSGESHVLLSILIVAALICLALLAKEIKIQSKGIQRRMYGFLLDYFAMLLCLVFFIFDLYQARAAANPKPSNPIAYGRKSDYAV
ncbi:hypothetical protein DFA_05357 [Cavenderia fasciculata]|uniref:Uncharacterized protein n=1 Tax=Cavenderia fasciculata TaxID=261658 RepID=F4PL03_CACFS|nr:uncharacterized protein DFA_05357 [Cavenderia fasciculata]EGG23225.1 hypothetical protein DFA_05357 [Cavenderia fasciculata]|eukprot:XP_004361076.1 hypothetical protein DFA_05357 [Cavenderia fasciculata]